MVINKLERQVFDGIVARQASLNPKLVAHELSIILRQKLHKRVVYMFANVKLQRAANQFCSHHAEHLVLFLTTASSFAGLMCH